MLLSQNGEWGVGDNFQPKTKEKFMGEKYRGVLAQLTKRGKRVLVRATNSLNHLLRFCRQDVELHLRRPLLLLLLLCPVISDH